MTDAALLPVVAAALVRGDRVLVQQRPPAKSMGGLWEFPGGKIEKGEAPESALIRELHEELGIGVDPSACVPLALASAPLGVRHLLLLLFRVQRWQSEPRALEASALRWVIADELAALPMPPADRPLVAALAPLLAG